MSKSFFPPFFPQEQTLNECTTYKRKLQKQQQIFFHLFFSLTVPLLHCIFNRLYYIQLDVLFFVNYTVPVPLLTITCVIKNVNDINISTSIIFLSISK